MSNREDIIKKYIDDKLSSNKTWYIRDKYNEVKSLLEHNWYNQIFISWSLARWTSIKPINDIDIICEIDSKKKEEYKFNKEKHIEYLSYLDEIFNILVRKYWIDNVKLQSHSIWILFWEDKNDFSIDIVPAIKLEEKNKDFWDNIYEVPEIYLKRHNLRKKFYENKYINHQKVEWLKSDPKWYINKAKEIESINDNFIYASIFLKKWKDTRKEKYNKFLKSFHIEEFIKYNVMQNNNISLFDSLKLIQILNLDFELIKDRANFDKYIDDYVLEDDFKKDLLNIKKEIWYIFQEINKLENLNENDIEDFLDSMFDKKEEIKKNENVDKNDYYKPQPIKWNALWSNTNLNSWYEILFLNNNERDYLKKNF